MKIEEHLRPFRLLTVRDRVNRQLWWLRFETDLTPESVYFCERFISKSRVPFRDRKTSESYIYSHCIIYSLRSIPAKDVCCPAYLLFSRIVQSLDDQSGELSTHRGIRFVICVKGDQRRIRSG